MRIYENYSHIASLQFAYCKPAIRILQTDFSNTFLFFSYSFLSRPEGAVGPFFFELFMGCILQTENLASFY